MAALIDFPRGKIVRRLPKPPESSREERAWVIDDRLQEGGRYLALRSARIEPRYMDRALQVYMSTPGTVEQRLIAAVTAVNSGQKKNQPAPTKAPRFKGAPPDLPSTSPPIQ